MKLTGICMVMLSFGSFGQELISIPCGSAVADGTVVTGEWDNASFKKIGITASDSCTVFFQHDDTALFFMYAGNLQTASRFPELSIDVNNDKSAGWLGDDWWFHVSATDCEYQGQPDNYDSCMVVRPNWTGVPNMVLSGPNVDTIEISIPFTTLGTVSDTFGIVFDVTNTFNTWNHWPSSADYNTPATWANAVLENCTVGLHDDSFPKKLRIYPNPTTSGFRIGSDFQSNGELMIYNLKSQLVHRQMISLNQQVAVNLEPGVYHVVFSSENVKQHQQLIILSR